MKKKKYFPDNYVYSFDPNSYHNDPAQQHGSIAEDRLREQTKARLNKVLTKGESADNDDELEDHQVRYTDADGNEHIKGTGAIIPDHKEEEEKG